MPLENPNRLVGQIHPLFPMVTLVMPLKDISGDYGGL